MAAKKEQAKQRLTAVEKFFQDYPDAPFLLKVNDVYILASSEAKANDLARRAGCEVEKIFNPKSKPSSTDATS